VARKDANQKTDANLSAMLGAGEHQQMTKTEVTVATLRDALLRGQIKPGERMFVTKIAKFLGVSATPVREALRLLQAEGLITQTPHKVGSVPILTAAERAEIYMLRAMLESKAVELATENCSPADIALLRQLHTQSQTAYAARDYDRFIQLNADLHFAIYNLSGTRTLREYIVRLWIRVPWHGMALLPTQADGSIAAHQAILDAMASGDAQSASALMHAHIVNGGEALARHWGESA
jgi:DNA-binding GntR family transcriptional regulator